MRDSSNQPPSRPSLYALAAVCVLMASACGGSGGTPAENPPARTAFVHADGERLLDSEDNPISLHGISFGTWTWNQPDPPITAHDEDDYAKVASLGANTVRLLFNAQIIEDDAAPYVYKDAGLAWLDQNVAWAKNHGLYLVLDLVIPQAGSSADCGNDALWDDVENQNRLVAMWRMLAARYAREQTIAGYAVFDEANPDQSLEQWHELGARLVREIRQVDSGHLVLISRALSIACAFDMVPADAFALLDDSNVAYEFDRFKPWEYVAQLLASTSEPAYGPYPSQSINPDPDKAKWLHASWDSRPAEDSLVLPAGDSPWSEEHFFYTVTDKDFDYAVPALQSDYNAGTAYFDDITVNEYDEQQNLVRVAADIDIESADPWYFWQGDAAGNPVDGTGSIELVPDAHRGKWAIAVSGTTTQANLADNPASFRVKLGYTYEVSGWMKGKAISPDGQAMIRLDFYHYDGSLGSLDKGALTAYFDDFVAWGHAHQVPLSVCAFGTGLPTFSNDLGGLDWVGDMIDVMAERNLSFAYYGYHDPEWGIYSNADGLPDPNAVNQPLLELLSQKLH